MKNRKKKQIFYGKQFIDNEDIINVNRALKEELITTGKNVDKFEKKISALVGSKYALSCINGTAALHLALLSIKVKKNDIILMPIINFISAYRVANLLNAKIYLIDTDSITGQISLESIKSTIQKFKLKKIKAIISMYLGGYPENISELYNLKKKYKCFLIEDACHAFGAKYLFRNKRYYIGSCKHSDISVFSFHPVKSITTGEGGAITTNSKTINNKIKLLRSHGIERNKNYWKYEIDDMGFNYRLSDLNCALGIGQISKLSKFVKKRESIYLAYKKLLSETEKHIIFPKYNLSNSPSYHLFIILIKFNKLRTNKDHFFKEMNKQGIFPQTHYIPINKFSFYKKDGISYPGSIKYFSNAISLPIYYNLKVNELKKIAIVILNYIKVYKKI